MRQSETCPKCGCRKIYVVREIASEHAEDAKRVALPVAIAEIQTGGGMLGPSTAIAKAGHFAAYVCSKCGWTEWYAEGLEAIGRLAAKSSAVRVIDHETGDEAGPYRKG